MNEIKIANINDLSSKHKSENSSYEYIRKNLFPRSADCHSFVSIYEIPPHKSAYPYHYHHKNEETFFILSGEGLLKTPDGNRIVKQGDLMFFPANSSGAHKLTNISDDTNLVYIDFDATFDLDVSVYPDSNKISINGKEVNKVYDLNSNVDYYKNE